MSAPPDATEAKPQHRLPDFLIIGGQKCGSNFVLRTLRSHPDIYMGSNHTTGNEEVHFFDIDANYRRGVPWYRQCFPSTRRICGEKTPEYSFVTKSHARMAETVPEAKLRFLLRRAADRAYSEYHMRQRHLRKLDTGLFKGHDIRSFEQAIEVFPGIVSRGFYIDQIESLLTYFPREQLKIVVSEEMRSRMRETLDEICDFVGVRRLPFDDARPFRSKYPPMKEGTRRKLERRYAPYQERLYRFLGRRISAWER